MKTYIFTLLVLFVFRSIQAQIITTIAGNGSIGYSGDGGPATAAKFTSVTSVAVDNGGNVYISDGQSNVIRKTSSSGIISTFAGNDTAGFSGDNGPATAAKINYPDEIALDKKGNVYFYDMVNRRVRKVDALGIITTFAGNGTTFTSSGIPATATGISGGGKGLALTH